MSIPKYNEMYKEFLICLSDGEVHKITDVKNAVFKMKGLNESDRLVLIPNGTQPLFENRIGWTRTYLKKAGLVITVKRGFVSLTDEGKKVAANMPEVLDDKFLCQYECFKKFKYPDKKGLATTENIEQNETPQDVLDRAHQEITAALADDILSEIMKNSSEFFEHLVVMLLRKMGYGGAVEDSGMVVGQTGDEGIDGIIKGLFITTAKFSQQARDYVKKQHTTKVVLVDGLTLAKLMIDYELGVSTVSVYPIKKLDTDFFEGMM